MLPLKPRDYQIAESLGSSEILQVIMMQTHTLLLFFHWFQAMDMYLTQDNYKEEVAVMIQSGYRAEIEALFVHGYDFLAKYIGSKIVQANYI